MDVKTAFLNGYLDEEIYMDQPEGFIASGQEKKVCKLIRSLYGLKQAPKQWHMKFDEIILSYGFVINQTDECVYHKIDKNNKIVILCLYVDDILIFGSDIQIINDIKHFLSQNFDMKDLGQADLILNTKIMKNENGYVLSQSHYIEKILKNFYNPNCQPVSTPYDPNVHLKKNTGHPQLQREYAQIIGSLGFLTNYTRPDIAYAVNRLSRYTSNPDKSHWDALERILRYLKGTINYGLHYKGYPSVLEGYSDANWISDSVDVKSTTGFVFLLGGGAVSWKSTKQTVMARSTMESEMIALDTTSIEAEWLKDLLTEIPLMQKPLPAISIHCDCRSAIDKCHQENANVKMNRHLKVRHKSLRYKMKNHIIALDFVRSEKNLADHLTKGLSRAVVLESSRGMGLSP